MADRDQRRHHDERNRLAAVINGQVDPALFDQAPPHADAFAALAAYEPYMARQLAAGVRLSDMTRHLLGLFAGRPGARAYRQTLSTHAVKRGAGLEVVREAVAQVRAPSRALEHELAALDAVAL